MNVPTKMVVLVVAFAIIASSVTVVFAGPQDEDFALALSEYLISARIVIARNQDLINDKTKGFKGFTPEAYEQQVRKLFLEATDIDIATVKENSSFSKTLRQAHVAAKQVIAEAQDQINAPGVEFKNFIGTVFVDRLCKKFEKESGVRVKLTSFRYRNERNKPDQYESVILADFEKKKNEKAHYEEVVEGGKTIARYMVPIFLDNSCLNCHGEPAGARDISGFKKEGYRDGDFRGAISIKFPVR